MGLPKQTADGAARPAHSPESTRRSWAHALLSREAAPYWLLFAAALAVRLIHHEFMRAGSPLYGHMLPGGDDHTFDRWALEISQTFWLGWRRLPFWQGPLYPYFPLLLGWIANIDKQKSRVGTVLAFLIPYANFLLIGWVIMLVIWYLLGLPVGPDSPILLDG